MKKSMIEFTQEMHSDGPTGRADDDAKLSIRIADAGGGSYLVLNADEWAIDTRGEIDELCAVLEEWLTACEVE